MAMDFGSRTWQVIRVISEGIEAKATEEPDRKSPRSVQLISGLHRANTVLVLLPLPLAPESDWGFKSL